MQAVTATRAPGSNAPALLAALVKQWAARQTLQCVALARAAATAPAPQLCQLVAHALLAGVLQLGQGSSRAAVAALTPQAAAALFSLMCELPSCRCHLDAFAAAVLARSNAQAVLRLLLADPAVQGAAAHSPAVLHALALRRQAHLRGLQRPAFSWAQPSAKLPGYPEVQVCEAEGVRGWHAVASHHGYVRVTAARPPYQLHPRRSCGVRVRVHALTSSMICPMPATGPTSTSMSRGGWPGALWGQQRTCL